MIACEKSVICCYIYQFGEGYKGENNIHKLLMMCFLLLHVLLCFDSNDELCDECDMLIKKFCDKKNIMMDFNHRLHTRLKWRS